jgi:hypothetical protein
MRMLSMLKKVPCCLPGLLFVAPTCLRVCFLLVFLAEEELEQETPEVYVSFIQEGDRVGIAFYRTAEEALECTSFSSSPADIGWMIQVFKQQIATPNLIITTSSIAESTLKELSKRPMEGATGSQEPITVKIVKAATCTQNRQQSALYQ